MNAVDVNVLKEKAAEATSKSGTPETDDMPGIAQEVQALLRDLREDALVLPNDHVPYPWAARRIFTVMGRSRELYARGDGVVELKDQKLQIVTPAKLRSRIDAHGRRVLGVKFDKREGYSLGYKRCSADVAETLLNSQEVAVLPPIHLVSKTSLLVEVAGELRTFGPGYHPEIAVLVLPGPALQAVPLTEAVPALLEILGDWRFTDPSDRSRALAGFIGPAPRAGKLVPGHALINCVEADQPQTGKGYLQICQQAVYAEVPVCISQTSGGVGSFDEKIAGALIGGRTFVALDNVRGTLNSPYLESVITSPDSAPARVPYKGTVMVDVQRMSFQLASNGIAATADLSERMLITRLLHQPPGYRWRQYPEGGLRQHLVARQPYYLGCVHAVIKEWHRQGKPRLPADHSFHEWVGTLDWIVQRVMGLPPLMAGHEAAVERVANPALTWLRAVALAAVEHGRERHGLSATALITLAPSTPFRSPEPRPTPPRTRNA